MTPVEQFMKKHNFNNSDINNLRKYYRVVIANDPEITPELYLANIKRLDVNGGKKMVEWIETPGNWDELLALV